MNRVLDEKGFVQDGEHLVLYFPAWKGIVPIRVIHRVNKEYERYNYGPAPIQFSGFPAGVMPPAVIDPTSDVPVVPSVTTPFTFPNPLLPPEISTDMWYFTESEMLFHVKAYIKPYLLRGRLQVPTGTTHVTFHAGRVTATSPYEFGYFRGVKEMIFIPNIHVGWILENKTNMAFLTSVVFEYAEYKIELVKEPEVVFELMTKKLPAYWFVWGGEEKFRDDPFRVAWKYYPIKRFPPYKRTEAIDYISSAISAFEEGRGPEVR